ncbi:MAG TPA: glycosyltransferase [Lapillicoccus sp.]|nr:glycosyltransferase [Lapillicoccus sp.]
MTGPRVVAVLTAHDPTDRLARLVGEVAPQVQGVVVVDDGSTSGLDVLAGLEDHADVRLHRQPNSGVAAALNTGVRSALADGADAVLTLDQDSGLPPTYVARAVRAWQDAVTRGIPVAFVAAATYSGRRTPTRGVVGGYARAFDPMQSGSLVPAATYRDVGCYDEGLVIDAVDSEFTVRCLAAGLEPLVAPGCDLEHGMGERHHARLLGRDVAYNHHSPDRVYFMARNGTLVSRRHLRDEPGWVLRRLTEEAKAHTLRLVLDPDRAELARAGFQGVRDGLRGRTGPR